MMPRRLARLAATSISLSALAIMSSGARAPSTARIEKLLAKGDTAAAIAAAEAAVAAQSSSAPARTALARAYLQGGRFASAEAAYADVLTVDPTDGTSALKLALVKIALGKTTGARGVLDANRDRIPGPDFGLALALSGDVETAVQTLEAVTRAPSADIRARQNLALAYALQGKWLNARVMAVQDLSPAEADGRIIEWMNFVRPATAHDQVATLLGVPFVEHDAGQPAALALNRPAPAPAFTPAPEKTGPTVEQVAAAVTGSATLVFAAMKEVVQPVPTLSFAPVPTPVTAPAPTRTTFKPTKAYPAPTVSGRYVVQLGAYGSDALAATAWHTRGRRLGLANFVPSSAQIRLAGATYVRLSVGAFQDRGPAVTLCGKVRARGGQCFVRQVAGDRMASWVRSGMPERFASR